MAERKPLFQSSVGYPEEMATTDTATFGGLAIGSSGINMQGYAITGLPSTPGGDNHAASKTYVDSVAQGLSAKEPVKAVETTTNIDVSTGGLALTIDGVAINTDGWRVLLTNQTDPIENGIWVAHSGSWTRPADFDTGSHAGHAFTFVEQGTSYADTGWVCTTNPPNDVVDTNSLAFVQFSAAGVITAGNGLEKSGNTISVKKGDGIEITSNGNATNIALSASNPCLSLAGSSPNKTLELQVAAAGSGTGGLEKTASGVQIDLDGTTLQLLAGGISVKGLPQDFEVSGVATHYDDPGTGQVTAANLDTLTAGSGSNADSLHTHSAGVATETPKVENTLTVNEAIAIGDPVYFTNTNNRIGKGDTVDPKANIVGVARTAQGTPGATAEIVNLGPAAGVLSGATAGDRYYLQDGGGVGNTPPGSGKRVISVGFAINATDLFVLITDYGKKA